MSPSTQTVTINGATRLLGFVGSPVIYAKSPENFNPRIAEAGWNAVLVPMELKPDTFDTAIAGVMAIGNLDGLVVTMPFKERMIPKLDSISPRARTAGAVNAAKRTDEGAWIGDMFDGVGFLGAIEDLGITPRGLRVGLIGAGAAGAAIAFALAEAGAASLCITDRVPERAAQLAERASTTRMRDVRAASFELRELDLLVNATPVGMASDDGIATDVEGLSKHTAVVDIVTRPSTPLLREAARRGCPHVGGSAMVAAQTKAILRFFFAKN